MNVTHWLCQGFVVSTSSSLGVRGSSSRIGGSGTVRGSSSLLGGSGTMLSLGSGGIGGVGVSSRVGGGGGCAVGVVNPLFMRW